MDLGLYMQISAREKTEKHEMTPAPFGQVQVLLPPPFWTLCIFQVLCAVLDLLVISVASAFWCSEWDFQQLATYPSFYKVKCDSR